MPPPEWDQLLIASQKNQPDTLLKLLQEDHVSPNHANPVGQSALHIASWWGHSDCVKILLEHGANAQACNRITGGTPLHGTIQSNRAVWRKKERLECLRLLLEYGADPNAKDDLGKVPLDYLEDDEDLHRRDIEKCFELALKEKENKPELFTILECQNEDHLAAFLTRASKDHLQVTFANSTPLLYLVSEWCGESKDDDETTFWYQNAIRRLLQVDVDVESLDENGSSCVDLLCEAVAISLTIAKDAWLEIARRNFMGLATMWQGWSVSPDGVVNRQGMTPLQFAARSGHVDMVQFLVENFGTDMMHFKDERGRTALDAAQANQRDGVVEYLKAQLINANTSSS